MKICPVGARSVPCGQTDGHEPNSRHFLQTRLKMAKREWDTS